MQIDIDSTVKHVSKRQKIVFQDNFCLIQFKSIAKCSKGSILQYFRSSLSYHLSLKASFCLFLSDRFTQVLFTVIMSNPDNTILKAKTSHTVLMKDCPQNGLMKV